MPTTKPIENLSPDDALAFKEAIQPYVQDVMAEDAVIARGLADNTFPNAYAGTLPKGVTETTVTAQGSGGTAGTYTLGVSGGPAGFAGRYVIGSDGKVPVSGGIIIDNPGLASASTAPTLSFPSGGITGAAATATVRSLIREQLTYYAVSEDGKSKLLWRNSGGAPEPVLAAPGLQVEEYLKDGLDGVLSRAKNSVPFSTWAALAAATGMAVGDRATVETIDTGTHTDPVVGGTVNNAGLFEYFASPAGWKRIADSDGVIATAALAASRATIASIFTRAGNYSLTGTFSVNASWMTTDFLELSMFDVTALNLYGVTTLLSVAFWDANFGFISGIAAASNGAYVTSMGTIPGNAVYVTFTDYIASRGSEVFKYAPKPKVARDAIGSAASAAILPKLFTLAGFYTTAGLFSANASWAATPLMEISALALRGIRLQGATTSRVVAWFDDNKVPIGGVTAATSYSYVTSIGTIPAGAKYVAFCYYINNAQNQSVDLIGLPFSGIRSDGLVPVQLAQLATTIGYILQSNGNFVADTNWLSSDFLPASPGEVIAWSAYGFTTVATITWYDSNKARVASSATGANGVWASSSTAPAGTAYKRFSFGRPGYGTTGAGVVNSVTENVALATFMASAQAPSAASLTFSTPVFKRPRAMRLTGSSVVVLYGDSRTSTAIPFTGTTAAAVLGTTVSVKGISGSTVAQQASDANLATVWAASPDAVIYMPGGNDTGAAGSVGSLTGAVIGETIVPQISVAGSYSGTYFVQAIDYVIRRFKAQYDDIRTRAGLTGSETEAQKNDLIRALKKPMLIVCTDLPQQRASAAYGLAENLERKRQAIIDACAVNKVHCVDTMSAVGWNMALEPTGFTPPGDPTYANNGVYTTDGLHPNEFGLQAWLQIVAADAALV